MWALFLRTNVTLDESISENIAGLHSLRRDEKYMRTKPFQNTLEMLTLLTHIWAYENLSHSLLLSFMEMGRGSSDPCVNHRSMEHLGFSLHCYTCRYISSWANIFLTKKILFKNGHSPRYVSWSKSSFSMRHISNRRHWAKRCWILYYINREVLIWNLLLQHPPAAFGLGRRSSDYFCHTAIAS